MSRCGLAHGGAAVAHPKVRLDREALAAFCRKWRIAQFSLFGSVLRDDFGPDSDVDVLVSFADSVSPTLDDYMAMEQELQVLFGRPVDLVRREVVEQSENWIRRQHILRSLEPVDVG